MLYFNLLTSGKLYEHLAEIDTSARDMAEYLIKGMAKKQGVTEELKANWDIEQDWDIYATPVDKQKPDKIKKNKPKEKKRNY